MNISSVSTVLLFVYSIIENGTRRLPWTPKASIYFSLQKLSGVTCDIIQSGLVSFLNSSPPCAEAVVSLDGKLLSNKCSPPAVSLRQSVRLRGLSGMRASGENPTPPR